MAFPPGFLDELRGRISLAGLVGRRVKLIRRGREHAGLCPFHSEKSPSFYVVEDKNFFHCFGCGAHGDAIGFVMRADNLDFLEAVEKLAGEAGLAVPQATPEERERAQRQKTLLETLEAAAAFYEARLWAPGGSRAREYLHSRGLDPETIRRFRLGWAPEDRQTLRRALTGDFPEPLLLEAGLLHRPEDGEPFDYFRNRVMFPIGDRAGRVIAFGGRVVGEGQPKYLNSPDSPVFAKGRVLYGWSAARAAREAEPNPIVTEGYMDVIALHRAGFVTAVAPLGTALTEFQLHELWRLGPEPILCFDGDAAGQRAAAACACTGRCRCCSPGHSLRFAGLPRGRRPGLADPPCRTLPVSNRPWRRPASGGYALGIRGRADAARYARAARRASDPLAEHVQTISDRTVRREYRRSGEALRPLAAVAFRGASARSPHATGVPREGPAGRRHAAPARMQREILFCSLAPVPDLIERSRRGICRARTS